MSIWKKIIWPCYVVTFILFVLIYLWGSIGVFGGAGHAYRLISFYVIIPGTVFIVGGILGYQNAYMKWLYPILAGILARILARMFIHIVLGNSFTISLFLRWNWPAYSIFLPILFALAGIITGIAFRVAIQRLSNSTLLKLKKISMVFLAIGFVIGLIHVTHAATLDRIIEYTEVEFSSPNVPIEIDGYRIAFIVDTHTLPGYRLMEVVEELNNRYIDLLLLGGDFPSAGDAPRRSMEILSHTITTDGIFGVEGNHDNYVELFAAKRAHGITPLSNSGLYIRDNFFLAGVEDLWNRNPSIDDAIYGSTPDDFVLLVSHNPDISMLQDTTGVDLILSGHTHGGQITFFGIWAPYFTFRNSITNYGQHFTEGWATSKDGTPVFVSRGTWGYLPRVFARPQVILITLVRPV
ncbi:MAG: metallophosphoesterase [Defluviitaleaceae bacterium]|nr:metallophosphoesterase [Defluviitaleaceae bacterium]